jgi:hypothetical protein
MYCFCIDSKGMQMNKFLVVGLLVAVHNLVFSSGKYDGVEPNAAQSGIELRTGVDAGHDSGAMPAHSDNPTDSGIIETEVRFGNFTADSFTFGDSRRGGANVSTRFYKAGQRYHNNIMMGDSETVKASGCCCLITGLIVASITCGVLYAGHKTSVYNRTASKLTITYRPGCTETYYTKTHNSDGTVTKTKHRREIDCVDYVLPNSHDNIYNLGALSKLCVEKTYGYGSNRACATQEALKHDYHFYAHTDNGRLILTRGTSHPVPTYQPTAQPSVIARSHNLRRYWNGVEDEYISEIAQHKQD